MNFKASPLPEIVRRVAEATGFQIIFGDDLQGRSSITVKERVSKEEAFQLMNAALFGKGFIALQMSEGIYKIVPVAESLSSSPAQDREPRAGVEEQMVTLLSLEYADASQVASTLKNFVATGGTALAYTETNSIILVGTEAQLRRLMLIARTIDESSGDDLMVRAIRHRSAETVSEIVSTVFNESPVPTDRVEIWPDERTNMVVVRANKARIAEVREFIETLDVRPEGTGEVQVIRIKNRDAEDVASLLRTLSEEHSPRRRVASDAAPQKIADVGQHLAGRDVSITVDQATRSLLVRADAETMEAIYEIIELLDRVPPRVVIEAVAFQLSRPSSYIF